MEDSLLNIVRSVSLKPLSASYHPCYCCVSLCRSRLLPRSKQNITEKLSFHYFPNEEATVSVGSRKNVNLRAEWKRRLGIGKRITKSMRVCSRHFKQTDFVLPGYPTKAPKLKNTAYPTLCLPQLSMEIKLDVERKKKGIKQNNEYTLPSNLCLKQSKIPGGYEVWSLEDIGIGIRFGPYEGVCVDESKRDKNGGYQWRVERKQKEIIILDGGNKEESNWLRYVNYAPSKQQQNLIAVQCQSEVYYVTCKPIPENAELLVWYQDSIAENETDTGHGALVVNQYAKSNRRRNRTSKVISRQKPHQLLANKRKRKMRISTWNVRTMGRVEKLENLKREMERGSLDIVGLCETWWKGTGDFRSQGLRVVYSGGSEERNGVAVVMNKEVGECLECVECINERIMVVRIRAEPKSLVIVQADMPTSNYDDEEIQEIYERINGIVEGERSDCFVIVMGDWNAVVGEGREENCRKLWTGKKKWKR